MLRIKAISPLRLADDEVARREDRYRRLAGDGIEIDLVNLPPGAPERLDSDADIRASEALVHDEACRTDPGRHDLVLPDCVLDPIVGLVDDVPVPVLGILQLATGHLAALGQPFAAVTRNAAIGAELAKRVADHGHGDRLQSVARLDADFCLISDQDGWADAMRPLAQRLGDEGVRVLVNGCSAVDIPDNRLGLVTVVDPTRVAMRMLAVAAAEGLVGARAAVAGA